jgi:hypothetical protein
LLRNNGAQPVATGGSHWLEYLPDHLYCFLPSYSEDEGRVKVYDHVPCWLTDDFSFCTQLDINKVKLNIQRLEQIKNLLFIVSARVRRYHDSS